MNLFIFNLNLSVNLLFVLLRSYSFNVSWLKYCWSRLLNSNCSALYCSFLAHASDINDLLEGLNGIFKDWLDRLHDTKFFQNPKTPYYYFYNFEEEKKYEIRNLTMEHNFDSLKNQPYVTQMEPDQWTTLFTSSQVNWYWIRTKTLRLKDSQQLAKLWITKLQKPWTSNRTLMFLTTD